jgi:hypothetical protein
VKAAAAVLRVCGRLGGALDGLSSPPLKSDGAIVFAVQQAAPTGAHPRDT